MRGSKAKQLRQAARMYMEHLRVTGGLTVRSVYQAMKKEYKENKKRGIA